MHLIDQRPDVCGASAPARRAPGWTARQVVLGSAAPHPTLLTAGEHLEAEGWRIEVVGIDGDGGSATMALRPTHRQHLGMTT